MKKVLYLFIAVLLCLSVLGGCLLLFGKVTIRTQQKSYPADVAEITVVWRNRTFRSIIYGYPYQLQA